MPHRDFTGKGGSGGGAGGGAILPMLRLLGILRLVGDAQSVCPNGRTVYERIPGYRLQGFEERAIVGDGDPIQLLRHCASLCQRTNASSTADGDVGASAGTGAAHACGFFNFMQSRSLGRDSGVDAWGESRCLMPVRISGGQRTLLVADPKYDTYNEICLNVPDVLDSRCPNKLSVFTRMNGILFRPPDAKRVDVASREECQERCLTEPDFVCRSATFDTRNLRCFLSRYVRSDRGLAHGPENEAGAGESEEDFDYLENQCLGGDWRCQGRLSLIKTVSTEDLAAKDFASSRNVSAGECAARCRDHAGLLPFTCRSFHHHESSRLCVLSDGGEANDEDGHASLVTSSTVSLYRDVCLVTGDAEEWASATVPLPDEGGGDNQLEAELLQQGPDGNPAGRQQRLHRYEDRRSPILVRQDFERHRNFVIDADYYATFRGVDVASCLRECIKDGEICMSAIYNPASGDCRLSRFDQRDARLVYDAAFDFYQNNDGVEILPPLDAQAGGEGEALKADSDSGLRVPLNAGLMSDSEGGKEARTPIVDLTPTPNDRRVNYYQNYNGAYRGHPLQPRPGPPPSVVATKAIGLPPVISQVGPFVAPAKSLAASTQLKSSSSVQRQSRCSRATATDTFRQVRSRTRIRGQFVQRRVAVGSLYECEQECVREIRFVCRSFNYIFGYSPSATENCELSDRDSRALDIDNPAYFEVADRHDYYQRETREVDCIDVSQSCNEDYMEFTLRTPEPFRGRIYTYKHYDRPQCFVRGTGERTHVLRIPGVNGYPDCGTEKFGDTTTNIVVVQFSEVIQTRSDLRYNLTCTVRAPGSAIVSSGVLGAGSGQPTPIEYLPAEHTLDSRVRLVISYQGRPTTTIAVGDPLEFKLETQEGENLLRDIFATNVVAKDPYTSRSVQLIDSRGCPMDPFVFPALGLSREGDGLTTNFNAFKIPESNFLVFEATVRTCRNGCQPAVCDGPQGREDSFGRRRRRRRSVLEEEEEEETMDEQNVRVKRRGGRGMEEDFNVREMFRVYETREEISKDQNLLQVQLGGLNSSSSALPSVESSSSAEICLARSGYLGLVLSLVGLLAVALVAVVVAIVCYGRVRKMQGKSLHFLDLSSHPTMASLFHTMPKFVPSSAGTSTIAMPEPASVMTRGAGRRCSRAGNFHQTRYPKTGENSHLPRQHFSFAQPDLNQGASAYDLSEERESFEEEEEEPRAKEVRKRRLADPSEPIYTDTTLFERRTRRSARTNHQNYQIGDDVTIRL